jgi:predicted nucleotidyltransferase
VLLQDLEKRKLIHPPSWMSDNTSYLTAMGSIAYGTNTDTSDYDVYGFCIPKKEDVFHHLKGEIEGFGKQKQRFEQWIDHGVFDEGAQGGRGRRYDFTVFNIVRYFHLALENNPNVIDSLFTPADCVLHCTQAASLLRDNRKIFLHKGIVHKLKGYAFSQLHKAGSQTREGKRAENVEKFGFDPKFLSHVVRLTCQAEDILLEGDLDLRRHREQVKTVKRGEMSLEEVRKWFNEKELHLQKLYETSSLRHDPDEPKVKALLLNCLEMHYGSLDKCITNLDNDKLALQEVKEVLHKYGVI